MGKSSFIWNSKAYNGNIENEDHRAAKLRVANLLLARGWSVRYELEIEINSEWTAIADIYAAHKDKVQTIDIELDGAAHNTTAKKAAKDRSRDRALAEKGIITIRYLVEDVNGKVFPQTKRFYKLTDEEIVARINAHIVPLVSDEAE